MTNQIVLTPVAALKRERGQNVIYILGSSLLLAAAAGAIFVAAFRYGVF